MRVRRCAFAILPLLLGTCTHNYHSLREAILDHQDEFPKPQLVVLPPAAGSRLGFRPEGGMTPEVLARRTVGAEPLSCFFVAPYTEPGLQKLEVSYKSNTELKAEVEKLAQSLGGSVGDASTAHLALTNLRIRRAVGIPNLNSPCYPFNQASYKVFTSEIVAENATLDFSQNINIKVGGKFQVPAVGGSVDAGWSALTQGLIQGGGIVLSAAASSVTVTTTAPIETDLGTRPGGTVRFPRGFDGELAILGYDDGEKTLTIRGQAPLNQNAEPPAGFTPCKLGASVKLGRAQRCDYWMAPGSALLSVIWDYKDVGGKRHVNVAMQGYRSNFTGPEQERPPLVQILDSHIKEVVYCPETQAAGGSNADDIMRLLERLPIKMDTIATNLEWQNYRQVVESKPVLVVVHASAFYKATQEMEGNQRLLNFLDALSETNAKILVYTRGLPGDSTPDLRIRWERLLRKLKEPELRNRAELFIMPRREKACFRDPDDGGPFQNKVREMLGM